MKLGPVVYREPAKEPEMASRINATLGSIPTFTNSSCLSSYPLIPHLLQRWQSPVHTRTMTSSSSGIIDWESC